MREVIKCRGCDGTRYHRDYSPGPCRACFGTGREHVSCADCNGTGGRHQPGWFDRCKTCGGRSKLDTLIDAAAIDLQRQRAAEAARSTVEDVIAAEAAPERAPWPGLPSADEDPVEPNRGAAELDHDVDEPVLESRVEIDEDALRAREAAWEAAEGSQVHRRGVRRRAA